jgi:hypothetical protein
LKREKLRIELRRPEQVAELPVTTDYDGNSRQSRHWNHRDIRIEIESMRNVDAITP